MISEDLRTQLLSILEEYLASVQPDPLGIRKVAAKLKAIPVYSDIGGCLLINLKGEIICFEWNDESTKIESDPYWRDIALKEATAKYPKLGNLRLS